MTVLLQQTYKQSMNNEVMKVSDKEPLSEEQFKQLLFSFTDEQEAVIDTVFEPNQRIYSVNAYAGSGKTSTIKGACEKIRDYDNNSSILLLVYNTAMKDKLKQEFAHLNVHVMTVHGFALLHYNRLFKPTVKATNHDYSVIKDIVDILRTKYEAPKRVTKDTIYRMVLHYLKSMKYKTIEEFLQEFAENKDLQARFITDTEEINNVIFTVRNTYNYLLCRREVMHDFYLKRYALEGNDNPYYDYIFIDEAQDLNAMMAEILKRMEFKKLYLVGDTYQSIYQFNGSINIMEEYKNVSKSLLLSKSFRLNPECCKVCNRILGFMDKKFLEGNGLIKPGHENIDLPEHHTSIKLFRARNTMIKYAMDLIMEDNSINIQFYGNRYSTFNKLVGTDLKLMYFFMEHQGYKKESKQLKDTFNLYPVKTKEISNYIELSNKDKVCLHEFLISNYNKEEYNIEREMYRCALLYKKLLGHTQAPELIIHKYKLIEKAMSCSNKNNPIITLGTAHSAKGAEWDEVFISEDCWSLDDFEDLFLVYVACSRAKYKCHMQTILALINQYEDYEKRLGWHPTKHGTLKKLLVMGK